MFSLKLASCMAENSESFSEGLAHYLETKLGIPAQYVSGIPWQERERLFDEGKIHIVWLCGLPYIRKVLSNHAAIELLAVPIPTGSRYHGKPIYFSDVVVRRDSPFRVFDDLRGSSWAYNEPLSHSGFNVVRAYLAGVGHTRGFFRQALESGAHTASLEKILAGRVDGAAIDSTVLEWVVDRRPDINTQIRVIETIGPSPIPPWVISRRLPDSLRMTIREMLLTMHEDEEGRGILAGGCIAKFAEAQDGDYDSIRRMAGAAETVSLV